MWALTKPARAWVRSVGRCCATAWYSGRVMDRRMIRAATAVFVAIAGLAIASGQGHAAACALTRDTTAKATEIVDGDTLFVDNGTQIRLVGIQAPKLPLGRKSFKSWPLAEDAKNELAELSKGRMLTLSYGGARRDRYGRALAHLHDETGVWIQGELLRRGLARVYSFRDNRNCIGEMLALEREARQARRGIWRLGYYAIRSLDEASRHVGSFQLVEGRVREVATVKKRTYLNFGENWRTDFTISISPRDRRQFLKAGIDPASFRGRRIRVRGWLKSYNGPMIEVTHPEQIETLDE